MNELTWNIIKRLYKGQPEIKKNKDEIFIGMISDASDNNNTE